jgi:hypothetical protein
MKNLIIRIISNKVLKYIKYLQKNKIEILQDKEGSLIYIGKNSNDVLHCYLNKPIEIKKDNKKGIIYKSKIYFLEGDK